MSPRLTLATAGRVLRQVRHDPRTVGLLVVVPCVLMGLLAWIFQNTPVFDRIGAPLLGVFPFVVMFLVTSIATLREHQHTHLGDPASEEQSRQSPKRSSNLAITSHTAVECQHGHAPVPGDLVKIG